MDKRRSNTWKLKEWEMMLMRTDPFRELERLTQRVFGTSARPAGMPMDAWQEDGEFVVAFDLPGVKVDLLDLNVEVAEQAKPRKIEIQTQQGGKQRIGT